MTDNTTGGPDDLDVPTGSGGGGSAPAPKRGIKSALGKKNTIIGIGLFGALAVTMGYFTLDGGHSASADKVPPSPPISNVVGSHPVSPVYQQQVNETNAKRVKIALATGTSALPEPNFSPRKAKTSGVSFTKKPAPSTIAPPPIDAEPAPDPDFTPSPAQTAPASTMAPQTQPVVNLSHDPQYQALKKLFARKQTNAAPISFVVANDIPSPSSQAEPSDSPEPAARQTLSDAGISLPPAGALLPAQMINGLDSDDPGPALAVVTEGPLKGARVIGNFQTGRNGLIVKFTRMTVPLDGGTKSQSVSINADAITLTKNALATSVNNHFISNLAVLFVTSLATNAAQIATTAGTTLNATPTGSVLSSTPSLSTGAVLGSAAGEAVGQAGQEYQQLYGNRPPTIKLAPGTPFTLAFIGDTKGQSIGPKAPKNPVLPQQVGRRQNVQFVQPAFQGNASFGFAPTQSVP